MSMINPVHYIDSYKAGHVHQYPPGTSLVYSNLTARSSRVPGVKHTVFFGLQYLLDEFFTNRFYWGFFAAPKEMAVNNYQRRLGPFIGEGPKSVDHIAALHDLGYLPVKVSAVPEGTHVPIGVPMLTIHNTLPEFFWVTNYFETLMSAVLWPMITSATTASHFRHLFDTYAKDTSDIPEFVDWQGHDFSMRGMMGVEAACMSGAAHLLSFTGTDTIPAIDFLERYYIPDAFIGGSVPATEHSVMCMDGSDGEFSTFKRLITEVYPSGIVSIVSDSWDYWKVIVEYLPVLKSEILARNGKVVIRPDSGDPLHIVTNTIPQLWETFGGTLNSKGYRQLNPCIGLIYGDGIDFDRAAKILATLKAMGYASTNMVFGLGSYTYQHVTRDTYGMAMKATYGVVDGEGRAIFKKPKTDDGTKFSARGLLHVTEDLQLKQDVGWGESLEGALRPVWVDGEFKRRWTLSDIRARVRARVRAQL